VLAVRRSRTAGCLVTQLVDYRSASCPLPTPATHSLLSLPAPSVCECTVPLQWGRRRKTKRHRGLLCSFDLLLYVPTVQEVLTALGAGLFGFAVSLVARVRQTSFVGTRALYEIPKSFTRSLILHLKKNEKTARRPKL